MKNKWEKDAGKTPKMFKNEKCSLIKWGASNKSSLLLKIQK